MRKILAVILLAVVVVIGLIVGLHSRNVYRFSYNYDVTLSYGGQKNATVSNVKLIVPTRSPDFMRVALIGVS